MTKKLILSALAASALAFATLSYAAPGTAPSEPASATQVAAKIDMTAALKAAQEKFPEASALSASLHGTRGYGLVWDARIIAVEVDFRERRRRGRRFDFALIRIAPVEADGGEQQHDALPRPWPRAGPCRRR